VKTETIQLHEEELRASYPNAVAATDGGRRLIQLPQVHFPAGCKPETGSALIVLDPATPKPDLYLTQVPTLPSGNQVSIGTVTLAGQTWQTFSFNVTWEEGKHTAIQFVEGKLARLRRGS
jgi:hypothetical protein